VAAAYGRDPRDRARAGELLVLQRVHPSVEAARSALDAVAAERAAPGILTSRFAAPVGRALARTAIRATLARLAAKAVLGGGAVVGAVANVRSTERLATRAIQFYKGPSYR
jgi:hypothetical protein